MKTSLNKLDSVSSAITSQSSLKVKLRIIEPLASRCVKFRFREIPTDKQFEKLEQICKVESITYSPTCLKTLIDVCEGDLRKSTNLLQTVSKVYKKLDSIELVNEIAGVVFLYKGSTKETST